MYLESQTFTWVASALFGITAVILIGKVVSKKLIKYVRR